MLDYHKSEWLVFTGYSHAASALAQLVDVLSHMIRVTVEVVEVSIPVSDVTMVLHHHYVMLNRGTCMWCFSLTGVRRSLVSMM